MSDAVLSNASWAAADNSVGSREAERRCEGQPERSAGNHERSLWPSCSTAGLGRPKAVDAFMVTQFPLSLLFRQSFKLPESVSRFRSGFRF